MRGLRVLFRTRGGHQEGMGDVTGSLALAEAFRKKGHEVFWVVNDNPHVLRLLEEKSFSFKTWEGGEERPQSWGEESFDVAILNQLDSPETEARIFKEVSRMLVTIDDRGAAAALADLRFNVLYPVANAVSGPKYIALSDDFQLRHTISTFTEEEVETILVTQGGSDTHGFTPKILRALSRIPKEVEIQVVLGPNFAHRVALNEVLQTSPRSFHWIEGETDLSYRMLEVDMAISAGGITLFELACLGVPTIAVCGERFEVETAERLEREGFCQNLGFGGDLEEETIYSQVKSLMQDFHRRTEMSRKGKMLVDGEGAFRMVETILENYAARVAVKE